MNKGRFEYIDVAKGLGIILVVLFHMPNINELSLFRYWGGWITSFYMPFFFILSGLFFKSEDPIKRLKSLLIPYIAFFIIGWGVENIKVLIKGDDVIWESILYPFCGHTIGYTNTPIWFLLSLAEVFIMTFFLVKFFSKRNAFLISFFLGITGYFLGKNSILQPYYLNVSFLCMPFYFGGYYFKDVILKSHENDWLYGIIFIIVSVLCYIPNTPLVNVSQCYIEGYYLQFLVVCVSAFVGLLFFARTILNKSRLLKSLLVYFGKSSIIILCTHMLLMVVPGVVGKVIILPFFSTIVSLFLIMLIEVPIIILINTRCKQLIGK